MPNTMQQKLVVPRDADLSRHFARERWRGKLLLARDVRPSTLGGQAGACPSIYLSPGPGDRRRILVRRSFCLTPCDSPSDQGILAKWVHSGHLFRFPPYPRGKTSS